MSENWKGVVCSKLSMMKDYPLSAVKAKSEYAVLVKKNDRMDMDLRIDICDIEHMIIAMYSQTMTS